MGRDGVIPAFLKGGMGLGKRWMITMIAVMSVLGVGILLYPAVSQMVNRWNGSYAIQEYKHLVDAMNVQEREAELEEAKVYNAKLQLASANFTPEESGYEKILDFGNGIMGYVEIPDIDVKLPIYHGVTNEVLEKGVGHLPTSSFPIPGEGNHAVLTGHTGLPSASLFTNLDQMQEGDCFEVIVGDAHMIYQVDQIKVVLPDETADLQPISGEDYCTLVTCTPYGVNSHRLLVRGSRVESQEVFADEPFVQPEQDGRTLSPYWLIFLFPIGVILLLNGKRGNK